MVKQQTPQEVYDELSNEGSYEEAHLDKEEIRKVLTMTIEDYIFGKTLRKIKEPNWRVIFNVHYDVFRELCDQLMRFEKQKTSNHKGLFAFVVLNFKDLEFNWDFLESIRTTRNKNKYQGLDISKQMWKDVEMQFDVYIAVLINEIKNKIN